MNTYDRMMIEAPPVPLQGVVNNGMQQPYPPPAPPGERRTTGWHVPRPTHRPGQRPGWNNLEPASEGCHTVCLVWYDGEHSLSCRVRPNRVVKPPIRRRGLDGSVRILGRRRG
jgi:hypothetical protein